MCVSCGCGSPNDKHGDERNITLDDLNQAAEAAGTTRDRVIQNIMSIIQHGNRPGSQTEPVQQGQQAYSQPADRYNPGSGEDSGTAWGGDKQYTSRTSDEKTS